MLASQLTWHWEAQLRPRLDGLSDDEYLWEPVRGCWNLRPKGTGATPMAAGAGALEMDYAFPEPDPAPVTTIAWRIAHLLIGVFGQRNARYFGAPAVDFQTYDYPAPPGGASAAGHRYGRWVAGISAFGPADLAANCREPGFESDSMAALILHIHREVIHHGAEISCCAISTPGRTEPRASAGGPLLSADRPAEDRLRQVGADAPLACRTDRLGRDEEDRPAPCRLSRHHSDRVRRVAADRDGRASQ